MSAETECVKSTDTENTVTCGADADSTDFITETQVEADKGSLHHQLFLGRYYTKLARADEGCDVNGLNAVNWLLKASSQGSKEATTILKGCLEDKIGVTDDNVDAIKSCLNTSEMTKSIRIAARRLYHELQSGEKNADGNWKKEDYIQKVRQFTDDGREKKFLISTANKVATPNLVIEDEFVDTVARRMNSGQIDPSTDEVEMAAFDEASISRKISKYPGTMMTVAVDGAVEFITTDLVNLLMYLIPIDQLNVLIFFFFFSLISISWLFSILSLTSYYLAYIIMIITTLQILKNKKKQREVKAMASMLQKFSEDINIDMAESEFVMNGRKPYWVFLASLSIFIPSFFLANKAWIPCSEFSLVSMVIALFSILFLVKHDDPVVIVSLCFDLLSCLPIILSGFPNIPIVSDIVQFLTVPFYSAKLFPGFLVNFSIPALEYAILPILFIHMAYKDKWQGVYKVLMPHLVGFFWLQVGVLYYDHSTLLGLARGSLGYIGFVLLFPFVTIGGSVYGLYYSFTTLNYISILRVVVTILLLLTPALLSAWQGYGFTMGAFSLRGRSLKMKFMAILVPLLLAGVGFLLMTISSGDSVEQPPFMPWEVYREKCGKPAWDKTNMAYVQKECEHYRFMEMNWTGIVETVNITEIENPADSFLANFPDEIAELLKCLYGKPYDACDAGIMSEIDFQLCELRVQYGRKCHMKNKSTFTFLLTVSMPLDDGSTQNIPLIAGNEFQDIIFQLKKGTIVEFQGILEKRLGTNEPKIKLDGLKCTNCMFKLVAARASVVDPLKQVRRALLQTISFFTAPLVEYHPPSPRKGI